MKLLPLFQPVRTIIQPILKLLTSSLKGMLKLLSFKINSSKVFLPILSVIILPLLTGVKLMVKFPVSLSKNYHQWIQILPLWPTQALVVLFLVSNLLLQLSVSWSILITAKLSFQSNQAIKMVLTHLSPSLLLEVHVRVRFLLLYVLPTPAILLVVLLMLLKMSLLPRKKRKIQALKSLKQKLHKLVLNLSNVLLVATPQRQSQVI